MTSTSPQRRPAKAAEAGSAEPARGPAYLLADHLDAALAMGEDLLTEAVELADVSDGSAWGTHVIARQSREAQAFVQAVRTLELGMTMRLIQARKLAQALRRSQPRFRPLVQLFEAGTAQFVDVAADEDRRLKDGFATGESLAAFVASRGIDERADGGLRRLAVGEDFRLHGVIRLGTLMDLIATMLDSLDLAFDLYASAADSGLGLPEAEATDDAPGVPLEHAPDGTSMGSSDEPTMKPVA
jgi:hypothetical protein